MWFPAAERRGEIHFYVAKSLPYRARFTLALALMAAGLGVQAAYLDRGLWTGAAMLFAGTVLLLTRGYANKAEVNVRSGTWRPARREEVRRIIDLNRSQRKWDTDAIDISNIWGCFVFVICAGAFGLVIAMTAAASPNTAVMLAIDAACLLWPFWFTGIRTILHNDALVSRAQLFLDLEDEYRKQARPEEVFQYQLEVAESRGGENAVAPSNVKALLSFPEGPEDFLGVQMQVSMNNVQGHDYPYFYCVLVARPGFGLADTRIIGPNSQILVEKKHEADVEIMVIRQATSKNSGYHTKTPAIRALFQFALDCARQMVKSHPTA